MRHVPRAIDHPHHRVIACSTSRLSPASLERQSVLLEAEDMFLVHVAPLQLLLLEELLFFSLGALSAVLISYSCLEVSKILCTRKDGAHSHAIRICRTACGGLDIRLAFGPSAWGHLYTGRAWTICDSRITDSDLARL